MELCGRGEFTDDLFAPIQPAHSQRVMAVLDSINAKWGRGTLRPGVVPATPAWSMRRELMSQSFTTRVDQCGRFPCGNRRSYTASPGREKALSSRSAAKGYSQWRTGTLAVNHHPSRPNPYQEQWRVRPITAFIQLTGIDSRCCSNVIRFIRQYSTG